ncbi:MAG: DUF2513 domain-containing protein [Balneola sp.]
MKRDFELIKKILLKTEENPSPSNWIELTIDGSSDKEIYYHVKLLREAGLLNAVDLTTSNGFCWLPRSLTWEGHNFLDNARNDTVWKKSLKLVKEKGGSVSFNVFQNLLQNQATKLFEGL